ncbi:MAG: flagellar protein FlaG [Sulfuritalea sp.]|nr:flagellar protein FlaG [Sulfuritalea sp.]
MIVQNTSTNQIALPARRVSDDAPKVHVDTAKQVPAQEPSSQQLQSAVTAINRVMQLSNRDLKFTVDPATKEPVVQVVDTETGDLIRQIPSKEALAIASSIDQFLQLGVLLRQKA